MRPAGRRALVRFLEQSYRVSERKACTVDGIGPSTNRHRGIAEVQAALRMRTREIAAVRVRYAYKRIHVLLRPEGWPVNHKRVYRLYCEQGLNLRRKAKRKRAEATCVRHANGGSGSTTAGARISRQMPFPTAGGSGY